MAPDTPGMLLSTQTGLSARKVAGGPAAIAGTIAVSRSAAATAAHIAVLRPVARSNSCRPCRSGEPGGRPPARFVISFSDRVLVPGTIYCNSKRGTVISNGGSVGLPRSRHSRVVGAQFHRIVQRVEPDVATLPREPLFDEEIRDSRVFREQRAVEVCADGPEVHRALRAVFGIVAVAGGHHAEGHAAFAQVGLARVVLEADDGTRRPAQGRVRDHVPDTSLPARDSICVEDLYARQLVPLERAVELSEELVASADDERGGTVLYLPLERLALELEEVQVDQLLLAVLPAAHEEYVMQAIVDAVAGPELVHLHGNPAPLAPLDQRHYVPPVAVDIHEVGVEPPDAYRHCPSQYGATRPRETMVRRRSSIAV